MRLYFDGTESMWVQCARVYLSSRNSKISVTNPVIVNPLIKKEFHYYSSHVDGFNQKPLTKNNYLALWITRLAFAKKPLWCILYIKSHEVSVKPLNSLIGSWRSSWLVRNDVMFKLIGALMRAKYNLRRVYIEVTYRDK